ncbi:MAG: hypothetical protein V2B19_03860 [Pseudomonadota bacterium]
MIAAVLRILLLFKHPELSDDLFRYQFDGLMMLDGISPYAAAPLAATISNPAIAALVPRINHSHLTTLYPPAAQLIFACGAFAGGVIGMKTVLIFVDLVVCCLILGILRRLGLPDARLILYAWHPLALIEIGASGHIETAALCFILITLFITLGREASDPIVKKSGTELGKHYGITRAFLSGSCFAGAVLVKWIPLLFFPGIILLVPSPKRKFWFFGFGLTGVFLIYPFWPHIKAGFATLFVYLANWEFAGFGFRMLRQLTGFGLTARLILTIFGASSVGLIYTNVFLRGSLKKPFLSVRSQPGSPNPLRIIQAFYATVMIFLLTTPTLHPWYGLYLVFLLPFAAGPSGVVLSWSVFLDYHVLIPYHVAGQWVEDDWPPLLIVAAPVLAGIISGFFSANSTRNQRSFFKMAASIDFNDTIPPIR